MSFGGTFVLSLTGDYFRIIKFVILGLDPRIPETKNVYKIFLENTIGLSFPRMQESVIYKKIMCNLFSKIYKCFKNCIFGKKSSIQKSDSEVNKDLIKQWVEKSKNEENVFNKFISLWIAFNSFYFGKYGQPRDKDCIHLFRSEFKEYYLDENQKVRDKVEDFYDYIKNKKNDEESRGGILDFKSGKPIPWSNSKDFKEYLNIVSQIRNNLFHGQKDYTPNSDDEKIVNLAYNSLFVIFTKVLEKEGIGKE